jgi:hypothetical protein
MPTTKKYRVKITNYCGNTVYSNHVDVAVCSSTTENSVNAGLYLNQNKTFSASTFVSSAETLTYVWSKRTYTGVMCRNIASDTSLGTGATATVSVTNLNEYNGVQVCSPKLRLAVTDPCGTVTVYLSSFFCPAIQYNNPTGGSNLSGMGGVTMNVASTATTEARTNQTYRWQYSSTLNGTYQNITSNATSHTYNATVSGYFRAVVDNNCTNPVTSSAALVTINSFGGGTVTPGGGFTTP